MTIMVKISLFLVLVQSKATWIGCINNIGSLLQNAEIYPFAFGIPESLGQGKITGSSFA